MSIFMIGIDHNMAPVDVRAQFAFTRKNTGEALRRLKEEAGICGCIILSTCNRLELWVSTADEEKPDVKTVSDFLNGNTRSILPAEKTKRRWSTFFILPAD